MPQERGLYGGLAKYYDQIYHWKDYQAEADKLKMLIQKYKQSSGNALLDVACGTGKHISHLQKDFNCTGVDASRRMLAIARKNAPEAKFVRGEMQDFELKEQFDVILCLFSSIGHLLTREEVRKSIANFARHLKNGGVLIIEPWLRRSEWHNRTVHMETYKTEQLIIARVSFGQAEGAFSIVDYRYLIAEEGKGVTYVKDRHKMRFFEPDTTLEAMRKAGLKPEFTEDSLMPGRGLLIASKPT